MAADGRQEPNARPSKVSSMAVRTGREPRAGRGVAMGSLLSNLILDVGNLDRSLEFYHGMLQLPISKEDALDGHRLAYLSTGETEILLLEQPRHEQNPALRRSGGLVIKFDVIDLPTIARRLEQRQVTVLQSLDMATFGERTFLISDPDGYAVLLSERVGTRH